MGKKGKQKVRQRANVRNASPKRRKAPTRRRPDEMMRDPRLQAKAADGTVRPCGCVPRLPSTVEDEVLLRGMVAVWERALRKRTPTSRRAAINSLDTRNEVDLAPETSSLDIRQPAVQLSGCVAGVREFADGPRILMTNVHGVQDGDWAYVDDHIWLDPKLLRDSGLVSRIRLFDDLQIGAVPKGYSAKGLDRVGIDAWVPISSTLPFCLESGMRELSCPPIAGNVFDVLTVLRGPDGDGVKSVTMREGPCDMLADMLASGIESQMRLAQLIKDADSKLGAEDPD